MGNGGFDVARALLWQRAQCCRSRPLPLWDPQGKRGAVCRAAALVIAGREQGRRHGVAFVVRSAILALRTHRDLPLLLPDACFASRAISVP